MGQTSLDGYRTVTPYLKLPNCARLLEFLKEAFGAVEEGRLMHPNGGVLHAEVFIGDTRLMIHELPSPGTPKPSTLYLRVEDADAAYQRAIQAGATPVFEPTNMYFGARVGCVTDVSGNDWWISQPIENLTFNEIQVRAAQRFGQ